MLMLDVHTWIRFGVWMIVGLPMYFVSVRYYSLNNNTMHAKANGNLHQIQTSNGQANINYIADEKSGNNKKLNLELNEDLGVIVAANLNKSNVKVKPKAPLPSIVSYPVNPMCASLDSLSVTGALAALDEVLTKEELAIGPFSYENPFSRKISIDTVSNASNIHNEESVVALVHNEDIHHEFEHPPPILEEHTDIDSDSSLNTDKEDTKLHHFPTPSSTLENRSESYTPSPPPLPVDISENVSEEILQEFHSNSSETEVRESCNTMKDENEFDYYTPPDTPSMSHQDRISEEQYSNSSDVETNVVKESNNAIKNHMLQAAPPPPPPPPIAGFLTFKHKKPIESRPSFVRSKSEPDVVFRGKKNPPPPVSRESSDQEDTDDNIAIGTPQYKKVALKLNKLFTRRSMGLPDISKLTKPAAPIKDETEMQQQLPKVPGLNWIITGRPVSKVKEQNNIEESSGVVEEEVIKPVDIKKKLNELFRSDPRVSVKYVKPNTVVNHTKEELHEDDVKVANDIPESKEVNDKTLHRNLMGNTLKNIKLLKKESFNMNEIQNDK